MSSQVFIHYTGYLLDGTKFDSSYDKGEPFGFRLGKGKVISGWEAVAGGMKVGMKTIVRIPPEFAYGENGTPGGPIPPNAPLVRLNLPANLSYSESRRSPASLPAGMNCMCPLGRDGSACLSMPVQHSKEPQRTAPALDNLAGFLHGDGQVR